MKKTATIFTIIVVFISLGFSQSVNYIEGYIETEMGDTIYGKLKNLSNAQSNERIKFKNSLGKTVRFKIINVKSYKRGNNLYVKKNNALDIPYYMKVIENGELKLYLLQAKLQTESGCDCHLSNTKGVGEHWEDGKTPARIVVKDYYLEMNGRHFFVRRSEFKKIMTDFFISYAKNNLFAEKIMNEEYTYKNLKELVIAFNSK